MEKNLRQKSTNILRITTYDSQSKGKTTLVRDLAEYFNTTWVDEFEQNSFQKIIDKERKLYDKNNLISVAIDQIIIENKVLNDDNKYHFSETNVLAIKVHSDFHYNNCPLEIEYLAQLHYYDLFLVTDCNNVIYSQGFSSSTLENFKQNLIDYNKPFIEINGDNKVCLEKAVKIVTDLEKALGLGLTSHEFIELYNQQKNFQLIFQQIKALKKGAKKIHLQAPATIGNGILQFENKELESLTSEFEESKHLILEKFVPASGAATRMFKFLSDFISDFNLQDETIYGYINRSGNYSLETFIIAMEKFPFFDEVCAFLKNTFQDFENFPKDEKNFWFIKTILEDKAFNFINKPKAIIPFHKYENGTTNPIEEHLKECLAYITNEHKPSIHFTISEEHTKLFETEKEILLKNNYYTIDWSYSFQNQTTDSVALLVDGKLAKNKENQIIFRPGGHGALLYNLNDRNADLIFIKNIDNVSHNNIESIAFYKKALGGILLKIQRKVFNYLKELEIGQIRSSKIAEIKSFIEVELLIKINSDFENFKEENQIKILKQLLDRPIRICGMVKNENEPGGGPFWVKDTKGNLTLQIVESAQIDLNNEQQKEIFTRSTHFNPVDLVCGIKNYKGEKFNLLDFTDPETGFVVEKSQNGICYKSYELPGLWNGSMANWITIFVEVPLDTFNPVKTINDLLKRAHQPD